MFGNFCPIGVLQLRTFQQIQPFQIQQVTQYDIYIHKKGFSNMGVKIRDPHITKKNHVEFDQLELKILIQQQSKFQRWLRIIIPFKRALKIKHHQIERLNQKIKKKIRDYCKQSHTINAWAEAEIDSLIKIRKQKEKNFENETGTLIIEKVFPHEDKIYYYKTRCSQSLTLQSVKDFEEQHPQNMSYPFLIQRLFG